MKNLPPELKAYKEEFDFLHKKIGDLECELHPVKRTVKKYKVFPAGSFSAAGRFLCGEKDSVLFHGR